MASGSIHRVLGGLLLILVIGSTPFAGPAAASSPEAGERGLYRGQCRRLTRQIDPYERDVLPRARARGNQAWARATQQQVQRLWNRRADLCPAYGSERTLLRRLADQTRRFNELLATAGRAAATFFTGGAFGP